MAIPTIANGGLRFDSELGRYRAVPSYPLYPTPEDASKLSQVRLDVIKDNLESIIRATRAITVMMNIIEAEAELKKS
jgi:hypothetical protein